jgi:two-component system sensor histidine kinase ChiS
MRLASISHRQTIVNILSISFDNNISVSYVIKNDNHRLRRIRKLMEYSFDVCYRFGNVFVSDDGNGCALVLYPDKKRTSVKSLLSEIKLAKNVIGLANIRKVLAREAKGTSVKITLPLSTGSFTERNYTAIEDEIFFDEEPELKDYFANGDKATILVVEDNFRQNAYLCQKLSEENNVTTAINGKHALEKIRLSVPDLIISDIMMDEMDGFELADVLAKDLAYCHIPIIFLSARNGVNDKLKGLHTGAIDYIEKPFEVDQVISKIQAILRQRQNQENRFFHEIQEQLKESRKGKNTNSKPILQINKDDASPFHMLTKREKAIAECIIEGLSPREIARKSFISENTVNTHLRNMYEKLGVKSKFEMIARLQKSNH